MKIYYDLFEEREKRGINNIYLMRIEQIYPFPYKALSNDLKRFRNAEFVWCQEEPRNMGVWTFIIEPMQIILDKLGRGADRINYVGRSESASPATGLMSKHLAEQENLINQALKPGTNSRKKKTKQKSVK